MARETKAERLAREATEKEARLATEREEYPVRLMAVLERVSNLGNFDLAVKNGFFTVTDRNARYDSTYELPYSWSEANQVYLENLEWKVASVIEEQLEAQRRYEVKKEAERKVRELLTDEERELLGL